jgi:hypothetical protein
MQNDIRKYDNRQHLNSNLYKSLKVTDRDKSWENFSFPITVAALKEYITFLSFRSRDHGNETHCGVDTRTHRCIHIKGKAVLLQAWSGPGGSTKPRFPDFMTTAHR